MVASEVDGYRIEGELGRGASGVVYRVHDPALDRPMALKLLTDDRDAESRARFRLEARAAARVIHPNVVQVYGAGEHQGRPYILQELVDGLPVSKLLEARGRLSVPAVVEIGVQAAAGLAEAARVGVLHRDVKPHNLLITEAGDVKLADFGLAKLLYAPTGLTERGTTLGTPHYMSPEQGKGELLDPRSDQYALGATLFHLLTGRPPFDADGTLEILYQHAQARLPSLADLCPDCPAALTEVVARMLEKDPEGRFESFEDVVDALEAAQEDAEAGAVAVRTLAEEGVPEAELEAPDAATRAPWRERAVFAVAVGAAVAVVGAIQVVSPGPPKTTGRSAPAPAPVSIRPAPAPAPARDPFTGPEPEVEETQPVARARRARRPLRERSVDRLVRDLRRRPAVAVRAAEELGRRADQAATFPLIDMLERGTDTRVVEAAADALAELGDIRALERLSELASSGKSEAVREAAERAHRSLYRVEEP